MASEDGPNAVLAYSERLRRATDPTTPPSELADLAYKYAELRPLVAANPSAYPGLLEWLASLGEPAVLAAISARGVAVAAAAAVGGFLAELNAPAAAAAVTTQQGAAPIARRKGRRYIGVIAGGVAVLLVGAGGVFAVNTIFAGGSATESAQAFPSSTYSWQEVAIDPSLGQKLSAAQVLEDLPELKNLLDDEGPNIDYKDPDLKRSLWDYFFDNSDFATETSLDYEHDVSPWLGSRIAFGLVGDAPSSIASPFYAIEATDAEKGVDAVVTILKDLGVEDLQVSSLNGYVTVSSVDLDLTKVFAGGTLADTAAFSSSTSRIGSWGLGAFWASPHGAVASQLTWAQAEEASASGQSRADFEDDHLASVNSWRQEIADYQSSCPRNATYTTAYCLESSTPTEGTFFDSHGWYPNDWQAAAASAYQESLDDYRAIMESASTLVKAVSPDGSVAGSIRVVDGAVELVVSTAGLELPEFANPQHSSAIADLPASTVAAASISQFGSIVDTALSPEYYALGFASLFSTRTGYAGYQFESLVNYEGESFPELVKTGRANFEDGVQRNLGIGIPEELNALFGSDAILAVDRDFSCAVTDFTYSDGGCAQLGVGVVIFSENPKDTSNSIADLKDTLDESSDLGLEIAEGDDRVSVSRGGFGETLLARSSETLGQSPRFTAALPDLAVSFASAYVDAPAVIAEIENQRRHYSDQRLEYLDYFDGIESAGLTMSKLGNGDVTLRVRVVVGTK